MPLASATNIRNKERAATHIANHWSILTWTAVLLTVNVSLLWGEIRSDMIFFPEAVLNGQWWRAATFPLVHLSWYHFLLDAGGFLLLYSCLEEKRGTAKAVYILGAGCGTLLLSLAMDPAVSQRGLSGLSGIAHGLMAISAVEMLRTGTQRRWGCVSLAIVVVKSAYELWSGHVVFEFLHMGMCGQPIAASHAGGVIGGLMAYALLNVPLFRHRKGATIRHLKPARVVSRGVILFIAILLCASSLHSHSIESPPGGRKECVILLHGLCRSSLSMAFMERALKQSGYAVLNLDYASTRRSITDIALDDTVKAVSTCRRLGYKRIHFVTHSMGGIVVRRYLQDHQLPEGSRLVMLAPPNQGSELMDWAVASFPRLSRLAGPGASQLRTGDQTLLARLTPVSAEIGIIIGNTSWNPYFSDILPGKDDGKVTIERAKLAEMADFLIAECNHTTILFKPMIQLQVVNFLEHGRFVPMDQAQPISLNLHYWHNSGPLNLPLDHTAYPLSLHARAEWEWIDRGRPHGTKEKADDGMRIQGLSLSGTALMLLTICLMPWFGGTAEAAQEKDTESFSNASAHDKDMAAFKRLRGNLIQLTDQIERRTDLFGPRSEQDATLLRPDVRGDIRSIWYALLDNYLALDALAAKCMGFYRVKDKAKRIRTFHLARGVFLTQYRAALEVIAVLERNPVMDTILNEADAPFGLPEGVYDHFKYQYLNVAKAGRYTALEAVAKVYPASRDPQLAQWAGQDSRLILDAGKGPGPLMTLKNGLAILKSAGQDAWFPLQKEVAEWMGHTKVWRPHTYLIQPEQIQRISRVLEPGDILLERREWYLTNVGIPGFWTHAALFIGSAEQRAALSREPEVQSWLQALGAKSLDDMIAQRHPGAHAAMQIPYRDGRPPRVIEALSPGVSLTSLHYSATCDSLAVLRPRLLKVDRAAAVVRAMRYFGRPYDYAFDFGSDQSLVCTELIVKAYLPDRTKKGLKLPLERLMGNLVTPANAFVRQFDQSYGTDDQQMDLVFFLDGNEKVKRAAEADVQTFRKSWNRPKWHILVQSAGTNKP